jgi:hypothetical protein
MKKVNQAHFILNEKSTLSVFDSYLTEYDFSKKMKKN